MNTSYLNLPIYVGDSEKEFVDYEKALLRKVVFKIELDILILPAYNFSAGRTGDSRGAIGTPNFGTWWN